MQLYYIIFYMQYMYLQWDVNVLFLCSYMETREVGELQSYTVLLHEVLLNCTVLAIQRKPRE